MAAHTQSKNKSLFRLCAMVWCRDQRLLISSSFFCYLLLFCSCLVLLGGEGEEEDEDHTEEHKRKRQVP